MPRKRKQEEPKETQPLGQPAPTDIPEQGTPEYTELILLVHAGNLAEAELIKTELEANGIPAVVEGEGAGVAGLPDVGAGVPVLVPEEYADQAAELIAELESAKPEGNPLTEKDDDVFDEEDDELEDEIDEAEEDEQPEDEDLDDDEDDEDDEEDDEWDEEEEEDDDLEEDEDWDEDDDDEEEWDNDEA